MSRARRVVPFLALAAIWGTSFVAIDAGLAHFPPVLFAAFRYDVAGVVMLAYAVHAVEEPIPRGRAQWATVGVGAALLIAGYHAFLFVGQQYTTAAAAAVLVSLSPVLTTGFARAFVPSDALSPVGVLGVVVGLAGVAVVASPNPANLLSADVAGELLVFLAAASFALGSVLTRWIDAAVPVEAMEAWSMLGGAAALHAVSLAVREPVAPGEWTHPEAVGALAYLAVIASALGFLLYFDLLDRLGAVEINMVSYVSPIFTAVVGWLYLGQTVDLATVAGFALIAAGFVLVKRRAVRAEVDRVRGR